MERLLVVNFFKKRGFPTKADGLAFIKTMPKIVKKIAQLSFDLDIYREQKIKEFEEFFDEFSDERKTFLKNVKLRIKERAEQKKEAAKEAYKNELREEIMQEMQMEAAEKERVELISKNSKMFPQVTEIDFDICESFLAVIKNKKNLTDAQIEEVCKMKTKVEQVMQFLSKANIKLSQYAQL